MLLFHEMFPNGFSSAPGHGKAVDKLIKSSRIIWAIVLASRSCSKIFISLALLSWGTRIWFPIFFNCIRCVKIIFITMAVYYHFESFLAEHNVRYCSSVLYFIFFTYQCVYSNINLYFSIIVLIFIKYSFDICTFYIKPTNLCIFFNLRAIDINVFGFWPSCLYSMVSLMSEY